MNTDRGELLGFFGGQTLMLGLASNENLLGAALIPVAGYTIRKIGKVLKLKSIEDIGRVIFKGGVIAAPGALVGRTIVAAVGEGLLLKGVSFLTGSFVTYQTFNQFAH